MLENLRSTWQALSLEPAKIEGGDTRFKKMSGYGFSKSVAIFFGFCGCAFLG